MKRTKKILSVMLVIMFALSFGMPQMADAAGPDGPTDVVITKVMMKDLTGWPITGESNGVDYDGSAITDLEAYFGAQFSGTMEGVAFRVYQGEDATGPEVSGSPFLTDANGQVTIPNLPNGTYHFVEDKAASTYEGADGEILKEAAAVPFTLTLPMVKADGTYFGTGEDALHVYPKNTVDGPSVEKTFGDEPENNVDREYNIGDTVPYKVVTTVPQGSEYATMQWADTMSEGLTFTQGSLVLMLGDTVVPNTNYTLVESDGGFLLALNQMGLDQLKDAAVNADVTYTLTYSAVLNENAKIGETEDNKVILQYGNAPTENNIPVDVTPDNQEITVTKSWADGQPPEGVTATVTLYETGTGLRVAQAELNAANNWTHTFTGLDNIKQYFVVESGITGYTPEYTSTGNGQTTVTNKKSTTIEPDPVKVITYGKNFIKTDGTNPLAGAEFIIYRGTPDNIEYLAVKTEDQASAEIAAYEEAETAYQEAIQAYNALPPEDQTPDAYTVVENAKAARDAAYSAMNMEWNWVTDKDAAFRFVTGEDGLFEVRGLRSGTYTYEEVVAPPGYAKLPPQNFEVGPGTYDPASPLEIINVKVTIPETGGIGTIVFAVVGLLLMGGAVVALRRKEEET